MRLEALTKTDATVGLLTTAPGIGPVTAAAFVSTIDDVTRFRSAHELEAYLGLVPSERSSGEKRQLGHLTKAGNARMRWLLVEAAWCILRSKKSETAPLRAWASAIATRAGGSESRPWRSRGGWPGCFFAMWRDGTAYDATRIRGPRPRRSALRVGPLVADRGDPSAGPITESDPPARPEHTLRQVAIVA